MYQQIAPFIKITKVDNDFEILDREDLEGKEVVLNLDLEHDNDFSMVSLFNCMEIEDLKCEECMAFILYELEKNAGFFYQLELDDEEEFDISNLFLVFADLDQIDDNQILVDVLYIPKSEWKSISEEEECDKECMNEVISMIYSPYENRDEDKEILKRYSLSYSSDYSYSEKLSIKVIDKDASLINKF